MIRCLPGAGPFVLLASYLKSGNTWVRACLTGYLQGRAPDIDGLFARPILSSRQDFDDHTALASADLTLDEIDAARPGFHASLAKQVSAPWFVKAHDAWYRSASGVPLFGRESCRGAVCIIRHPAAVAVSLAHHSRKTLNEVIATMADSAALHDWWPDAIDTRLPQRLSSWSAHVSGWLDQVEIPVLALRYEDMLANPTDAIATLLSFSGIEPERDRVNAAVRSARFERLQRLESASGFSESPSSQNRFFRAGVADSWSDVLSPAQRKRIRNDHGVTMQRLGYDL